MDRLWKVVKMTTFQIGAALAPALTRIADTFTRATVSVNTWIKQNRRWVVQVLKVAGAGPDHPFLADVQESRYLKAAFCRVLD